MNFVTVKEDKSISNLANLKNHLESEGIECFIVDGLSSQVLNYIPSINAKLQVRESDLERIKNIMVEIGEFETPPKPVCPNCGSDDLQTNVNASKFLYLIMNLLVMIRGGNINQISYKCRKCNFRFKE